MVWMLRLRQKRLSVNGSVAQPTGPTRFQTGRQADGRSALERRKSFWSRLLHGFNTSPPEPAASCRGVPSAATCVAIRQHGGGRLAGNWAGGGTPPCATAPIRPPDRWLRQRVDVGLQREGEWLG